MPGHLIVISEKEEDFEIGKKMARHMLASFDQVSNLDSMRRMLTSRQDVVVLWNTENQLFFEKISPALPKYVPAHRIFSVADKPISHYSHIVKYPALAHHLLRRIDGTAITVCSQIAQVALKTQMFGLENYFPAGSTFQKIKLSKTSHKTAAVEAIQNHLTKQGIRGRLAALVAQSTDELILNAIFDAPLRERKRPFHALPRESELNLEENDHVEVKFASCDLYMGVCVSDSHGSLTKSMLIHTLFQGPKSGLHGIYESGLSLLFILERGVRTEVILIFPKTDSYKEFKEGFRFLSLIEAKRDQV